ncbi:hypothetical protein [Ornithinibacillus contaminans]|uniref:hypothetical protein n=1 Tax=Ornithinibacillus contaminans TaxID=694055 RepID=UPI00064DA23A|nr:hypothetical protein [Ornithinibacillus contaminans]
MKINHLIIKYNGITKRFDLDDNFNLIHSKKNSVGKSTLLRFLFYSLGYNIPGTKNIKFNKCTVICNFDTNNKNMETRRENNIITLSINNTDIYTFVLPEEEIELQSFVWGTTNEDILKNILGAIYMDQEKGWTLLNRGVVIGSIHFNIEELVQGLSNRNVTQLREKQKSIELELKKYQQLQNIIEYKEHLATSANDIAFPDYTSELENKIQMLTFEKNELEDKLKSIDSIRKENIYFTSFIEKMKLVVKDEDTGRTIPVTKDTIEHFDDNQNYILARYNMVKINLAKVKKELSILNQKLSETQNLFDVQTEIERFDSQIAHLNVNPDQIRKIIIQLNNQNKKLKRTILERTIDNNPIVNDLHRSIIKFAQKLGVEDVINLNKNYIFTSDLKSLSGAVLHKIVFSFKMAYILEIQRVLGIKLPIVLDSPSGREIDQENIRETMNILMEEFSDNQVIIASIYKYNELHPLHTIRIRNKLMEG